MSRRPNLFDFATSELSQDAFICWLLSWGDISEEPKLQECAKSFVALLYNLQYGERAATSRDICDIRNLKKQYCHIDVYVQAVVKGKIVSFIIEDKIHTSHHSRQLERYVASIAADRIPEEDIVPIYFKTGYMYKKDRDVAQAVIDVEGKSYRYSILDHEKWYEFLQQFDIDHDIYREYFDYLGERFYSFYPRIRAELYEANRYEHFKYDFAQYDFMYALLEKCPRFIEKHFVYRGTNPGGNPFTLFTFARFPDGIGASCDETLFYRLDARKNHKTGRTEFCLSVRQHAYIRGKQAAPEDPTANLIKKKRLQRYREAFGKLPHYRLQFAKPERGGSNRNESDIAVLFFDEPVNTIRNVLSDLPMIHEAWISRISAIEA